MAPPRRGIDALLTAPTGPQRPIGERRPPATRRESERHGQHQRAGAQGRRSTSIAPFIAILLAVPGSVPTDTRGPSRINRPVRKAHPARSCMGRLGLQARFGSSPGPDRVQADSLAISRRRGAHGDLDLLSASCLRASRSRLAPSRTARLPSFAGPRVPAGRGSDNPGAAAAPAAPEPPPQASADLLQGPADAEPPAHQKLALSASQVEAGARKRASRPMAVASPGAVVQTRPPELDRVPGPHLARAARRR